MWTILSIPFLTYILAVFRYAINVPYEDDFDAALDFLNQFTDANTLATRIKLVGMQHNEHRIVLDRLAFLGSYYLEGEVNFRTATIFGNIGWLLTVAALTTIARKRFSLSVARLLPIPYILLSFIHYENMYFAMAAIQNYWSIFFSVMFLYWMSSERPFALWAILFPITLFTSGGGLCLYVLANFFLFTQKNWKRFWSFFCLSSLCVAAYFLRYHRPIPNAHETQLDPIDRLRNLFAFLGNIFLPSFGTVAIIPCVILGLLLASLSIAIIRNGSSDNFLRLALAFVILTATTVALTRNFGDSQGQASRYSVYPLLTLVVIYIAVSTSDWVATHGLIWMATVLTTTTYLWGVSAAESIHFPTMREQRTASITAFNSGDRESLLYSGDKAHAAAILVISQNRNIYAFRGNS